MVQCIMPNGDKQFLLKRWWTAEALSVPCLFCIVRMLHVTICFNLYTIVKGVFHSYWFKIQQRNVLKTGRVSLWAKSPSLKWILLSTFLRFALCDNKWKDCKRNYLEDSSSQTSTALWEAALWNKPCEEKASEKFYLSWHVFFVVWSKRCCMIWYRCLFVNRA